MFPTKYALIVTAAALAIGLPIAPGSLVLAQPQQSEPVVPSAPSDVQQISLKRGEVLQLIMPESREGAQAQRQEYYQTVLPIAAQFGYRRLAQLNVRQKVISDYDPGAVVFFGWPDQAAASAFAARPQYPDILAARPAGWNELKVFTSELAEDLELTLDPAKHYTVVIAWRNDEKPGDYDRYLAGIDAAVERAGGRFIYKMRSPEFEAHASSPEAPNQLTFVEWVSTDGFAKVQQSQEYLDSRAFFASGVERFEFYWLQSPAR